MSRVGKEPIEVPSGVSIALNGNRLSVSGINSSFARIIPHELKCEFDGSVLKVVPGVDLSTIKRSRSISAIRARWGLFRKLIANDVKGAASNFVITLDITGVGYKAFVDVLKGTVTMNLGFSHDVVLLIPIGVVVDCTKGVILNIRGGNKQILGDFASKLERIRKVDPYKIKGVLRKGRFVRKKEGKAG